MLKRLIISLIVISAFSVVTVGTSSAVQIAVKNKPAAARTNPLRIAVGAMLTPREGYVYYKQLLTYIGKKLNMPVKFVEKGNYEETNKGIKSGSIDIAFVCGGPYVAGHKEFGMELLAAPQVNGAAVYYSYIIVPDNSTAKSLMDLNGKTFAFTDPMSNTGRLVPAYMLFKMGKTPDSFFKKYFYTSAHDKSIQAVARRVVDGAAVDSLIWEYLNRITPELTSKTKVIERSPPYGIPPVVVRKGLDKELKEKIKTIFLELHNDPAGQKILQGMMIEKFVIIDDSAYNSIREMERALSRQRKE